MGGADPGAMALNEEAWDQLRCQKSLDIVPGATHLFDEPHGLEIATERAAGWFTQHLANSAGRERLQGGWLRGESSSKLPAG